MHKIVIYIDVFFIVNFLMDMLLLIVHRQMLGYTATYLRIAMSATLGAVWACIVEVTKLGNTFAGKVCTYIFIAAIMVRICTGKCNIKKWIRDTGILYAIAALVGGICHMVMYYTMAGYWVQTVIFGNHLLIISLFMSVVLIIVINSYIAVKKAYECKLYRVVLEVNQKSVTLRGFYDTGNVLRDTFCGKPVHIVEKQYLEAIFNEIEDYAQLKLHIIPFSSLGCESGILEVITADRMYIYGNEEVKVLQQPLIGMTKQHLSQDGAYDMLINGSTF